MPKSLMPRRRMPRMCATFRWRAGSSVRLRHPIGRLAARILEKAEGPNDGIVSVASAKHGESFDEWEADHLDLVNWPYPLATGVKTDRIAGYAGLVRRLADEGF